MAASVAEEQALRDAIHVSRMDCGRPAKAAAALGALGLAQVAPAGAGAQDLAPSRYLEPLGHRFLSLDAFWTSHKSFILLSKRARNICFWIPGSKRYF
jgi:hypothetical protein